MNGSHSCTAYSPKFFSHLLGAEAPFLAEMIVVRFPAHAATGHSPGKLMHLTMDVVHVDID